MTKTILNNLRAAAMLFVLFTAFNAQAQITGTVFRDFNGDGVRGTASPMIEPLQAGVIVNAYNANEQLVASFKSTGSTNAAAAGPNYSIPASGTAYNGIPGSSTGFIASGTQVRLEFIILSSSNVACNLDSLQEYPALKGVTYGSNVRFVTAGAGATNVNYGIFNASEYVKNSAPNVLTYFSYAGDPLSTTGSGTRAFDRSSVCRYPYTSTGGPTLPTTFIQAQYIGSTYGIAYSKQAAQGFSSAYMQHYIGMGPQGSGGIYKFDTALTTTSTSFYDLDGNGFPTRSSGRTFGSGSTNSYVVGSQTTLTYQGSTNSNTLEPEGISVVGSNSARGLATAVATQMTDASAVGQVGIVGLGDLDITDDGQYLFTTNLYDRKVYRLTLNSVSNPTGVSAVASYTIPNPPLRSTAPSGSASGAYSSTYTGASNGTGFYDGTVGVQRPFALKPYRGKLYIGTVTTGELGGSTSTDGNTGNPEYTDLWAYVWEMDIATGTFTSTPVLQFPLNYNKGTNSDGFNETWRKWDLDLSSISTGCAGCPSPLANNAQPMLTDIEFDPADGSMVISIRDRNGDQLKYDEHYLDGTGSIGGWAYGDILRAYKNPTGCVFELEKNGKEGPSSAKASTTGASNGGGPGGGEFYFDDNCCSANHLNLSAGSLAMLPGRNEVLSTFADPGTFWSNGWRRLSNANGSLVAQFQAYDNTTAGTAGKSCGMGDIELIGAVAPVEVGNRVWNDVNGDGIQNANEAGISGVLLELVDNSGSAVDSDPSTAGVQATFVTTDANGNWYITSATGTDATGINYGVALVAGTTYNVRLATSGTGNDWDPTANGGAGGPRTGGDLVGLKLTRSNIAGVGVPDFSDNDASMISSVPQLSFVAGTSGQNNHNLDIGFQNLAELGDLVWRDDNKNGVQDAGEPGVSAITVQLYLNGTDGSPGTADDQLQATMTTDAYGKYLFTRLNPTDQTSSTTIGQSSYNVAFTLPPNYKFTSQGYASNPSGDNNNNTNSDPSTSTGRTAGFNLGSSESDLTVDAGIIFDAPPATATVGDRVWLDLDLSGTQNGTEPGVSGVTVTLYDGTGTAIASTITNASGLYLFTNVPAGTNYRVGFSLPPGMIFTTKGATLSDGTNSDVNTSGANSGRSDAFNVATGDNLRYIDAGIVTQPSGNGSLGDFVWEDINRDGIQNSGEPGIAGVKVELYDRFAVPNLLATTFTDAFGNYIFNNLTPGDYKVKFYAPTGYVISSKDAGSNDAIDSDMDPTTGFTRVYTLDAGSGFGYREMTVDAGMYKNTTAGSTATLGDYVWFDYDRDGVQDATESGVGGITVNLLNSSGTAIATTTTNVAGFYKFVNLSPANYSVQFSNIPEGYSFTGKDLGGNDVIDSDPDAATGKTALVTLTAGMNYIDLDAGLVQGLPAGKGSLGNRVWYDNDHDGIQDIDEVGTPGVTVTLKNSAGTTIGTTITNNLGEYIFTQLDAGIYTVEFSNLTTAANGFAATVQNSGSDDAVDSDGGSINSGVGNGTSITASYSLAQGEDNMTVDLGLYQAPSATNNTLGNYVWFDLNSDGLQTSGEPGVLGVMVTLLDGSGNIYDANSSVAGVQPLVTVTNYVGYYQFTGLPDGSYSVMFSNLPAGFSFTGSNTGANDAIDSDPIGALSKTLAVSLNSSTPTGTPRLDISLDAGILTTTAALGNFVWEDKNGDGIQDAGEPGISGVTVTLYDGTGVTVLATAITDQNGYYFFPNLTAGTSYVVGFTTVPTNMEFTVKDANSETLGTDSDVDPLTGKTASVSLAAGEVNLKIDAGLRQPITAAVGDFVWNDVNIDGLQSAGEEPLAGYIAILYSSGVNGIAEDGAGDDVVLGAAITSGNGYYLITGVPPGSNYYVIFSNQTAGTYTLQNVGGTSALNNSKVNSLGITTTFSLAAGGLVLNLDAGINNLVPLPSHLIAMNCAPENKGTRVSWTVGDETGIMKYLVQRAVQAGWITIATIDSKGDVNGNHYSVVDNTTEAGEHTYRLQTITSSGMLLNDAACTSLARNLTGNAVTVMPNPTSGSVQVTIQSTDAGQGTIVVTTPAGQQVLKGTWDLLAGRNQITMNLSNYPAGTYIIKTTTSDGVYINKILKQ